MELQLLAEEMESSVKGFQSASASDWVACNCFRRRLDCFLACTGLQALSNGLQSTLAQAIASRKQVHRASHCIAAAAFRWLPDARSIWIACCRFQTDCFAKNRMSATPPALIPAVRRRRNFAEKSVSLPTQEKCTDTARAPERGANGRRTLPPVRAAFRRSLGTRSGDAIAVASYRFPKPW